MFSWFPLICPYPVMIGCFRKRIPCIKLYHFRIHYRAARFTDFYVGPIIRCLLTWLKLTILPHRFHPFTCFPCYYYQVPSFHVRKIKDTQEKALFLNLTVDWNVGHSLSAGGPPSAPWRLPGVSLGRAIPAGVLKHPLRSTLF
jgi:hypothetical protein